MEMKAVTECEEPKYLTKEESRNKMLRFIMSLGKKGLKIFTVMYICTNIIVLSVFSQNNSIEGGLSTEFIDNTIAGEVIPQSYINTIAGGLETTVSIFDNIKIGLSLLALIMGGVSFVLLMFGLKNMFKIKKIEDEEEKVKLKSKRETQFIYAGFILLISILMYVMCNSI